MKRRIFAFFLAAMMVTSALAAAVIAEGEHGPISLSAQPVTVPEGTTEVDIDVTVSNIPTDLGLATVYVKFSVDNDAEIKNAVKLLGGSGSFSSEVNSFLWADADNGIFEESADVVRVTVVLPEGAAPSDVFTVTLIASDDDDNYLTFNEDPEVGDTLGLGAIGSTVTITVAHSLEAYEAKAATCTEAGNDVYYVCSVCGKLFADENGETELESAPVVDALGHTAGEAVTENEVAATCTAAGGYDTVVYCSVCGEELSRESVVIDALGHTAGEAVTENEVAATCTAAGGYDTVIYCSVCGEELSREPVVIDALGHSLTHVAAVEASAAAPGNIEYWKCETCGKFFSDAAGENEIAPESVVVEYVAPIVLGDVNGDGKINSRDVIKLMQEIITVNLDPTASFTPAGDMNGDGKINARDVILLMNKIIEINTQKK